MEPSQVLTVFDIVSFISGTLSLVLSIIAIWLSLYFYKASRSSEVETAKLQVSIKAKVDDLAVINNDLLSAAIKHMGDSNSRMIDLLKGYNKNIDAATSSETKNSQASTKNIRDRIISAIEILKSKTGRAISLELFELLEREFDFGVILSELIRMHEGGILSWEEAPNPPQALSTINISPS